MTLKSVPLTLWYELQDCFTGFFLWLSDAWGSGRIGSRLRGNLLRVLGKPFRLRIGKGCIISTGFRCRSLGDKITIGDGTFLNDRVTFNATAPITLGRFCDIGYNVIFATANHQLASSYQGRRPVVSAKPIVVEDYVWIGANVLILPGVTIGRGAVVAGGSVVVKDVPPETLVAGNPAKVIKSLATKPEGIKRDGNIVQPVKDLA